MSGWEMVSGEFETAAGRGAYVFHVNPQRQAIYQVMRYRVELLPGQVLELAPSVTLRQKGPGVESGGGRHPVEDEPETDRDENAPPGHLG